MAGRRVMAEHDGDLRLSRWLEEARERDREAQAIAEIPWWKRSRPPG